MWVMSNNERARRHCVLCGYSSLNLNKYRLHLNSSSHTRGMAALWGMTHRSYTFQWVQAELSYQRDVCPSEHLETLLMKQRKIMDEVGCERWGCVELLGKYWLSFAPWFRIIMTIENLRRIRSLNLPEVMETQFLNFIPECNRSYEKLLANGGLNFQTLNSNMGHQLPKTPSMSSDATVLECSQERSVHRWRQTCAHLPICV